MSDNFATFDVKEFEKNIPADAEKFFSLGEYCYFVRLHDDIGIYIRSSIRKDGVSAGIGEDSIRVYYAQKWGIGKFNFLGKKFKWLKRVNGWNERLAENIEYFKKIDENYKCLCGGKSVFLTVKKESVNKGRHFCKCDKCQKFIGFVD